MLVKLQSAEMTAQRLSINLQTRTSMLFWTAYCTDFICFVSDCVALIEIVFVLAVVEIDWEERN